MTEATYTFDDDTVSDLHKDAFGFRPSHSFFQWWNCASDDEKQAEWDGLVASMQRREELRNEEEKRAIATFESNIKLVMDSGAKDRETAIRWIKQSVETVNPGCVDDVEYFEYLMGIPYGYISRKK